jgi:hypothetical protein
LLQNKYFSTTRGMRVDLLANFSDWLETRDQDSTKAGKIGLLVLVLAQR